MGRRITRKQLKKDDEFVSAAEVIFRWIANNAKALAAGIAAVVVVALLLAPWSIRNQMLEASPGWDQTKLHSYGTAFFRQNPEDPGSALKSPAEILARVQQRSVQIVEALGSRLQERTHTVAKIEARGLGAGRFAFALVLYLCLLVVGIRRRSSVDFYLLFHSVVIGLYFGFSERLVLPIFVFGVAGSPR